MLPRAEKRRVDRWKDIIFILKRACNYWFLRLVCGTWKSITSRIVLSVEFSLQFTQCGFVFLLYYVVYVVLVFMLFFLSSIFTRCYWTRSLLLRLHISIPQLRLHSHLECSCFHFWELRDYALFLVFWGTPDGFTRLHRRIEPLLSLIWTKSIPACLVPYWSNRVPYATRGQILWQVQVHFETTTWRPHAKKRGAVGEVGEGVSKGYPE